MTLARIKRASSALVAPAAATNEIGRAPRLNSSHSQISYAVFCLKKKKIDDGESSKSFLVTNEDDALNAGAATDSLTLARPTGAVLDSHNALRTTKRDAATFPSST